MGRQYLDQNGPARIRARLGGPVGIHIDAATLVDNTVMFKSAHHLGMQVMTYDARGDRNHAKLIRQIKGRSGLVPDAAIIDGDPGKMCAML